MQTISDRCPLDKIYKVLDIGYRDQSKNICPVLVEVNEPKLKNHYEDANYLLQCWDSCGRVVYQRALKFPHLAWAISAQNNTFMYVLDKRDEEDQCFHIVQLNECLDLSGQNKVEFKIRDWTGLCAKLGTNLDGSVGEMFLALSAQSIFVVADPNSMH